MVEEGAANKGLGGALTGVGFDFQAIAAKAPTTSWFLGEVAPARPQEAEIIRADTDIADVKALLTGCLDRERHAPDADARARMLAIISEGLRT